MPIYILMGDEPYYIDAITSLIESSILTDDEKLMNETIYYGKEANVANVVMEARQYPVMSRYRVVYLKEAQTMGEKADFSPLEKYLQAPLETTILVITYKGGTIDKRRSWVKLAEKIGAVFTSEKLKEKQLASEIENIVSKNSLSIDDEARDLLIEYIGSDLSQIDSKIKKFDILLPNNNRKITTSIIEKVVGISKDYNVFELINALFAKDIRKANLIIGHTSDPIQKIIPALYNAFSNLLIYQYMPSGSNDNDIALKLKSSPYAVWSYKKAGNNYTKMQTFKAIGYLRQYDLKSKGVNCADSSNSNGLLKEMIYHILH